MFHGKKDEVVPVIYSKKVLKMFKKANKKLVIFKKGDHSLSDPRSLNLMKKYLIKIIKYVD